jgi:glycosyltransferase involved in cell wall biosynthesis
MKPKVALIVQRYGEEVNGGAEQHARWLAERLLAIADVEVFTTCAVDFQTWRNHYPAGTSTLNGVPLHRFQVDQARHWNKARKQSTFILQNDHTLLDELAWIQAQGPHSADLLAALDQQRNHFDIFIFFTYIYATTYFGIQLVPEKALLIPTAHEEPYLELGLFRATFHLPRLIVYNTSAERDHVQRVTRNQRVPSIVAGVGINTPPATDPARFRQKYNIAGDFIFYVGRIDPAKNVPALIADFIDYQSASGRDVTLVLAGKSQIDIPNHSHIRPIGFISEQDKFDGICAAQTLIMPSLFESLSMVLLEAWLMGTPTLVNSRCQVLKDQSRRSNGGLWYGSSAEFAATLTYLLDHPAERAVLGENGKQFVENSYAWEIVLAKFTAAFQFIMGATLE